MQPQAQPVERPAGVYLSSLYFVVAGFLESIQKYWEWGGVLIFNPFSEHSVWHLATNTLIYLVIAYLLWQFARLGRLAGLVYGYVILAMYAGALVLWARGTPMTPPTALFMILAIFHVVALIPLVVYLQPASRKKLFHVSLLEILLPHD